VLRKPKTPVYVLRSKVKVLFINPKSPVISVHRTACRVIAKIAGTLLITFVKKWKCTHVEIVERSPKISP
jgi:hypothetical protein